MGRRKEQLCSSASIHILGGLKLTLGVSSPKLPLGDIFSDKLSQASGNPGSWSYAEHWTFCKRFQVVVFLEDLVQFWGVPPTPNMSVIAYLWPWSYVGHFVTGFKLLPFQLI